MTMNYRSLALVVIITTPLFVVGHWFTYKWDMLPMATTYTIPTPMIVYLKGNTSKTPYFIFRCKQGEQCGGLADRQKGIVTSYVISEILNTRFGIDMDKPCLLTNYLVPNEVDWRVPSRVLKTKNKTMWNKMGRNSPTRDLTLPSLRSKVRNDVIMYKGNIDRVPYLMKNALYKQLPWTKNLSHHDLYRQVYKKLFKLSSLTQGKLDNFLKPLGTDKLFCAHLRIGRNPTMLRESPRVNTLPNTEEVIDFIKKLVEKENSYKIFLATDSSIVKDKFSKSFGSRFVAIKGPITHVDFKGQINPCEGMEKAILDQKVLSLCDTLIMSRSGFSRMAALMRGSDQNLYEVMNDGITKVKRLNPSFFDTKL